MLASGGADKSVRVWDLATRETTATLKGHRTYVHSVAFTPDGKLLASAGGDLHLRNPATGFGAIARQEGGEPAAGLGISADGRLLVTAGRRLGGANSVLAGKVKFWDAGTATALMADTANPSRRKTDISPADAGRGESALAESLSGQRCGAWCVALDPGGELLAVGTDSAGVLVWDLSVRQARWRLDTAAAIRCLAFSGDGRLLAAAEASRVQVWDVRTGQNVALLKGHVKQVHSVAFSPRSTAERASLLSGGQDGTVRVWDVTGACERRAFAWPLDDVLAVSFAPDGMTAAAGGRNGSIVVWDCDED